MLGAQSLEEDTNLCLRRGFYLDLHGSVGFCVSRRTPAYAASFAFGEIIADLHLPAQVESFDEVETSPFRIKVIIGVFSNVSFAKQN
jgi:hypothetical protein